MFCYLHPSFLLTLLFIFGPTSISTQSDTTAVCAFSQAIPQLTNASSFSPPWGCNITNPCTPRLARIGCSGSNVTSINLGSSHLPGSIPTEVGLFARLMSLELYQNNLTGTIPTEIGMHTYLTDINMYSNNFVGSMPTQMFIPSLQSLYLSSNQLSGSVPTQIGIATSLRSLVLYSNKLTGTIPTEIGRLTQLFELFLSTKNLTRTIPTQLGLLTSLTQLNLANNQLTGSIPTQLGLLTALQTLYLGGNMITGCPPTGGIFSSNGNYECDVGSLFNCSCDLSSLGSACKGGNVVNCPQPSSGAMEHASMFVVSFVALICLLATLQ